MSKIIELSQELSNQIAAWEVIERPLSIVKELIENSIDSKATYIKIELVEWGTKSITISDNGEWMEKNDLEICLKRYATSKIQKLDDLYHLMTFWFRWEALSSISWVSKMSIISKHPTSSQAWKLIYDNESGQIITPTSFDQWTQVVVQDLFYNTPARLNYLKSTKTEYGKIHDYITGVMLAHPNIWLELWHNEKKVFKLNSKESLEERIFFLYWDEFLNSFIDILFESTGIKISWKITSPKVSFPNKSKQFLFINHRPISSPLIYKAILDGYNRFIPHGNFPGYILNIEVDPTIVDVNVHPRKQEVRFENESHIFRSVYNSIQDTLEKSSLIGSHEWAKHASFTQNIVPQSSLGQIHKQESYYTGSGSKFKSYSPYKNTAPNPSQWQISASLELSKMLLWDKKNTLQDEHIGDLHYTKLGKIIGQAFDSYILVENQKHLVVFDQHALAERVLYEKLISGDTQKNSQTLLIPENIKCSPWEYEFTQEYRQIFEEMGFEIEPLSHNIISVISIPEFIKWENLTEIFLWILSDLMEGNTLKSTTLDEVRNKIFAYWACRWAIKFGNRLNLFEMNALLEQAVEWYSSTCPHGRPVVFEISLDELKNKYER